MLMDAESRGNSPRSEKGSNRFVLIFHVGKFNTGYCDSYLTVSTNGIQILSASTSGMVGWPQALR